MWVLAPFLLFWSGYPLSHPNRFGSWVATALHSPYLEIKLFLSSIVGPPDFCLLSSFYTWSHLVTCLLIYSWRSTCRSELSGSLSASSCRTSLFESFRQPLRCQEWVLRLTSWRLWSSLRRVRLLAPAHLQCPGWKCSWRHQLRHGKQKRSRRSSSRS